MSNKQKKEFTLQEKQEFINNNTRINFWMEKELIFAFDRIVNERGMTRKDAMTKLVQKFVDKNSGGK
jgi:metal-responsive CopG/Arc/MetJ family transcriptional regulator